MKRKLLFFVASFMLVSGLLATGPGLAYYYPSTGNVPPGPPPNYNQVDTVYFLGTPQLPLPPPDRGGIYIYYDQGIWNVANHIYSAGNSFEQFHCCILAVMNQPPTLGVNVFAEQFELEVPGGLGDTSKCNCLRQNDRWGWIPWGDDLYEIWWDVSTRDWNSKCGGDPNDFMRFRITGCAVDFNLWSSAHGTTFGPNQIYLGANKTLLSAVPGFTDTYPGVNDPYQSQAGSDPEDDPNITIFTYKSNTLRSYNKFGLIHYSDWYWCDLAYHYGERYSGSFAYEGNGVEFSTSTLCPNPPPILIVPEDDSVHAGNYFISTDFSVSGGKNGFTVSLCGITPAPTHQPIIVENHVEWQTECADVGKVFTICLEATDEFGAKDTGYFDVTVYNRPPELTCPEDGSIHAPGTFVSTDFSVIDPDEDSAPVTFLDITPSATNDPVIVDDHVEWTSVLEDEGEDYIIRLVATDPCGLADTCQFTVSAHYEPTGELTCPENDSVHAGETFVSTYLSVTYPECDPSTVTILDITPPATNDPTVVGDHVEWVTTCEEEGDYLIRLRTTEDCIVEDTCEFTVTVYNRPPELICPDYAWVHPTQTLISTDFYVMDPDGDVVSVVILDMNPLAIYFPVIVKNHLEWVTTCCDQDYIIRLVATDPCGLADTCDFMVRVRFQRPPDFSLSVDPPTRLVALGETGQYSVGLTSLLGFANSCSLSVCWLPDPPNSALFDQEVMTPTAFTGLSVYTTSETDTGTYTMIVTGKEIGGPVVHHRPIKLNVQETSQAGDGTEESSNLPNSFALFQNQPNPFNPETQISYFLPQDCQVSLTIYNLLGQRVKTLFEGSQVSGIKTLTWDGTNDQGQKLSSGIYFYRLQADQFQQTKKMVLMK